MTYVTLDKADGPECPSCGCRDTEHVPGTFAGSWFGGRAVKGRGQPMVVPAEYASMGTAICGSCGTKFATKLVDFPVEPEPAIVPVDFDDDGPFIEPITDKLLDDVLGVTDAAKKVQLPPRLRCPQCNSLDIIVRSTKKAKPPSTRTWRNHFCRACDYTFQSYEETEVER